MRLCPIQESCQGHRAEIAETRYNATRGHTRTTGERVSSNLWVTRHKSRELARIRSPTLGLVHSYKGVLTAVRYEVQEVGSTLIGEKGLVVMTGAESVEWCQIHQTRDY